LASKEPIKTTKIAIRNITNGITAIPTELICSYAITILSLIGIFYVWKKNRQKYYFIFLSLLTGFFVPVIVASFTERYFVFLIVLFYLFAAIGIFKLYEINLKNNPASRSLLTIYLALFIIFSGLTGIGKGTLPFIPHSFYERFDAKKYFTELEEFYSYVKNNTEENDIIMASRRPYEVYYFTERPTIIFPLATAEEIQKFIKKYQVKWVIWMGTPKMVGDKYYRFWLPDEIPENIKPIFKNYGGNLFKVEYYLGE